MIIIDFSPVLVANAMWQAGQGNNGIHEGKFLMNEDQMRTMALNTIRLHVRRFKLEYGPEIVIAFDSADYYWRNTVFPYYKRNREKARDNSKFDWVGYQRIEPIIRKEFQDNLPYKTLEIPGAEADDIIATLVKDKCSSNDPIVIVSGDKDFLQLQLGNPNVKQYAPKLQSFITYEDYEYEDLDEHIIRGDQSDGIPNCLSDDDTFMVGSKRQVIMTKNRLEECKETKETNPKYLRNKQLIDFEEIPDNVQTDIRVAYSNTKGQNRMKLMNYFISKRIGDMLDVLSDF